MFEGIIKLFKKIGRKEQEEISSKETAKERLHLVLMQDRANVSADFLEMMKQEIIEVIKKYIDVDEKDIDVRLTNKTNEDGTTGAPALYANIPIAGIKQEVAQKEKKQEEKQKNSNNEAQEQKKEEKVAEQEAIKPKIETEKTNKKEQKPAKNASKKSNKNKSKKKK